MNTCDFFCATVDLAALAFPTDRPNIRRTTPKSYTELNNRISFRNYIMTTNKNQKAGHTVEEEGDL